MANLKKSTRRRQDSSWSVLSEGATVLVDTAPWIYLLQDHPDFAPRFEGLFAAAEEGYQIMPFSVAVAIQAAQLRAQYGLKLPDAAQLATALDMGAAALVTHDCDFSAAQGVLRDSNHIDPKP